MGLRHLCIVALLPLALTAAAWSAEPESGVAAKSEPALSPTFDLKSETVRNVVRTTASTQASTSYRIEVSPPQRGAQTDLAAALRQDRPVAKETTPAPRLPDRPPPCDGFWSCGLETLLGHEDFDDEVYGRVERNRLMNQGSFADKSKINASVALPRSPGDTGPLKPR